MHPDSPRNLDELLRFVDDAVRQQCPRPGDRCTGSKLAAMLRERFPNFTFPDDRLGVKRLADVVNEAQERGLLQRLRDVVHLEVSPAGDDGRRDIDAKGTSAFVRPDIWKVILFFNSNTRYFLDRRSHRLVELEDQGDEGDEGTTYEDDPQFIELKRVPTETQKGWMQDFANESALDVDPPLDGEEWWSDFPRWLRDIEPDLERRWRGYRVRRAIDYVRQWAVDHGVPTSALLTQERPPMLKSTSRDGKMGSSLSGRCPRWSGSSTIDRLSRDEEGLRQALLSALRDMRTDELLALPIPPVYLVRHLHRS